MSPGFTDRLIARVPLLAELRALRAADARWACTREVHRVGPFVQVLLEADELYAKRTPATGD
jgi:hypothetical protein